MKKILNYLFEHKTFSRQAAKDILISISKGMYNESELAAFMTVYLMRSITIDELLGFRDALLELCVPVNLNGYDVLDIVGTGGDAKNTFNISTLSCFVVAGAGAKVAKHGNYGVSSVSGASNVMELVGYKFKNDEAKLKTELEESGICFLHAPLFGRRRPLAHAAVTLALAHPAPQRLGRAANLGGNRLDRSPLRRILVLGVEDHAHRTFLDLGGKL